MDRYMRAALEVSAEKYEYGKHMEDGVELYSKVVTNGWISSTDLLTVTLEDGRVVCPFIRNRRGVIFIREGDYIIYEKDSERHVCGEDKFHKRFTLLED